jgi:hypothetical protein
MWPQTDNGSSMMRAHRGLCFGKTEARHAIAFKFSKYLAGTKSLPAAPPSFGHEEQTPPIQWGMNGNDQYGVCVVAGAAHETLLWNRMAGKTISITTRDTLEDFTAITGRPPSVNVGADMQKAASFRRTTGVRDSTGARHKIGAYLEIATGNLNELYQAMFLFGAVGIGVQFPVSAMDQFSRHQAWSVVHGSRIEAGHYIPCVALRGNIVVVTWGRFQAMRPSFFVEYCDEAVAYVSPEALTAGKSPEGFDYQTLVNDLRQLG